MLGAAHDAFRQLDDSLTPEQRSWLEVLPPLRMIEAFDAYPSSAGLAVVSPAVRKLAEEVERMGGPLWLNAYLRIVRVQMLVRTLARPSPYRLPGSVVELLGAEVSRLLEDAAQSPATGEAPVLDALTLLDIGLCRGAIVPFGFLFAQAPFRVSRRILEFGGLEDLPLEPWLGLHIPPPKQAYSPEWRAQTYARVAEFLVLNPTYHGAYGLAWVVDPVVAEISPNLSHVRQLLLDGGCALFATDTANAATIRNATSTSKTRRRLYEEGTFTPTDYALVWRRDDLMRWAERLG